mgnify:CR=1 FL=1
MVSTIWIPIPWNSLTVMVLFLRLTARKWKAFIMSQMANVTNGQMADLDWLLCHAPMEYAGLVVSGEIGRYLKDTALHEIEE